MEYPSTRAEAKATGATHYFTGFPCTRGHVALRKARGGCVECIKQDWAADNERRKHLPKSEASKAAGKRYYERNVELVKARAAARPVEEKRRHQKAWDKANPEVKKIHVNVRRRRHRQATPKWLSPEQRAQIRALYQAAASMTKGTGEPYEVDHIVPLAGENACGLHVPWNLQVVPMPINRRKSNRTEIG
jgi:hypothetical protein